MKNLYFSEKGASMVEVALLIALLGVICIPALDLLGGNSGEVLCAGADSLTGDDAEYKWNPTTKECQIAGILTCTLPIGC